MGQRFVGIDLGAEAVRIVELSQDGRGTRITRRLRLEHHKNPGAVLLRELEAWDWEGVSNAAVTGRLSRPVQLLRVPTKQAQARGYRLVSRDQGPVTLVSIGSHGFSVFELRGPDNEVFRENSRCSQGTGNFLRQLVGALRPDSG